MVLTQWLHSDTTFSDFPNHGDIELVCFLVYEWLNRMLMLSELANCDLSELFKPRLQAMVLMQRQPMV